MTAPSAAKFVVATPSRSVCDDNARALEHAGLLRFIALGTRRGTANVPRERTRLNPAIGSLAYLSSTLLSNYWGEWTRFGLHPWFDRWVRQQLQPGDHIISSYGYANESFRWVRAHGGCTFLDGGNSHPEHFMSIMAEEHHRWKCPIPPLPPHHYQRAVAMMPHVDFVLSPSSFVTRSFLDRGFGSEQILRNVYPLDLSCFTPAKEVRPADRPLTVISTGSLSLRKGTPYLLDAFRLVLRSEPNARLLLTSVIADSVKPLLEKASDLPIDWSPGLPHPQLARRLRSADVFVLPSLEDGFARTVTEALACGLPAIVTPNTGAADLVVPGVSGSITPIRDSAALAETILDWWGKVRARSIPPRSMLTAETVSFTTFEHEFLAQLRERRFIA